MFTQRFTPEKLKEVQLQLTYPINSRSRLLRLTPAADLARISTKICGNLSTMHTNSVLKLATCNNVSDCIVWRMDTRSWWEIATVVAAAAAAISPMSLEVYLEETSALNFQNKRYYNRVLRLCQHVYRGNILEAYKYPIFLSFSTDPR